MYSLLSSHSAPQRLWSDSLTPSFPGAKIPEIRHSTPLDIPEAGTIDRQNMYSPDTVDRIVNEELDKASIHDSLLSISPTLSVKEQPAIRPGSVFGPMECFALPNHADVPPKEAEESDTGHVTANTSSTRERYPSLLPKKKLENSPRFIRGPLRCSPKSTREITVSSREMQEEDYARCVSPVMSRRGRVVSEEEHSARVCE